MIVTYWAVLICSPDINYRVLLQLRHLCKNTMLSSHFHKISTWGFHNVTNLINKTFHIQSHLNELMRISCSTANYKPSVTIRSSKAHSIYHYQQHPAPWIHSWALFTEFIHIVSCLSIISQLKLSYLSTILFPAGYCPLSLELCTTEH